jgi:preprotein translocase subunit Sec63
VHSEKPVRPKRTLSPTQREALNQFIGLGARLDTDFTMQELRSAFRALARAYHPDRHARVLPSERAALSSAFVKLRSAYDALKTAA